MRRRPVDERLVCNVGLRLTVDDHERLIAYAEARDLRWQVALREIVHEALRDETTRPSLDRSSRVTGPGLREQTPA